MSAGVAETLVVNELEIRMKTMDGSIGRGGWIKATCAVAILLAVGSLSAAVSDPAFLRTRADGRSWQTEWNPSQALSWCWEDADAATLRVRPLAPSGRESSQEIVRDGSETYGSWILPLDARLSEGVELLYGLTLELKKGGKTVSVQEARIARLPHNAGEGISVRPSYATELMRGKYLFAYDAGWAAESGDWVLERTCGSTTETLPLSGSSGYGVLDVRAGDNAFCLLCGGEPWAEAALTGLQRGLALLLK